MYRCVGNVILVFKTFYETNCSYLLNRIARDCICWNRCFFAVLNGKACNQLKPTQQNWHACYITYVMIALMVCGDFDLIAVMFRVFLELASLPCLDFWSCFYLKITSGTRNLDLKPVTFLNNDQRSVVPNSSREC